MQMSNPRPITVIQGRVMVTTNPAHKLYRIETRSGYPYYVPLKDTDTEVACLVDGRIRNSPRALAISSIIPIMDSKVCECGKDKHWFASHSNWCPKKVM